MFKFYSSSQIRAIRRDLPLKSCMRIRSCQGILVHHGGCCLRQHTPNGFGYPRQPLMTALNSLARLTTEQLWVWRVSCNAYIKDLKQRFVSKRRKLTRQNLLWLNDQGQREIFAHLIIQFGLFMNNCVGSTMNQPTGTMFSEINT